MYAISLSIILLLLSAASSHVSSEYNQGYSKGISDANHDYKIIKPVPTSPDDINCPDNYTTSFCDGYQHGYAAQENKLLDGWLCNFVLCIYSKIKGIYSFYYKVYIYDDLFLNYTFKAWVVFISTIQLLIIG